MQKMHIERAITECAWFSQPVSSCIRLKPDAVTSPWLVLGLDTVVRGGFYCPQMVEKIRKASYRKPELC